MRACHSLCNFHNFPHHLILIIIFLKYYYFSSCFPASSILFFPCSHCSDWSQKPSPSPSATLSQLLLSANCHTISPLSQTWSHLLTPIAQLPPITLSCTKLETVLDHGSRCLHLCYPWQAADFISIKPGLQDIVAQSPWEPLSSPLLCWYRLIWLSFG